MITTLESSMGKKTTNAVVIVRTKYYSYILYSLYAIITY
jgi:hypothetical protein